MRSLELVVRVWVFSAQDPRGDQLHQRKKRQSVKTLLMVRHGGQLCLYFFSLNRSYRTIRDFCLPIASVLAVRVNKGTMVGNYYGLNRVIYFI